MRESTLEILHDGDRVLIEAPTASDALEAVTDELGTSARIIAVDRVVRGGFAGFFAKEMVQVVAELPADELSVDASEGSWNTGDGPDWDRLGERGDPLAQALTEDVMRESLGIFLPDADARAALAGGAGEVGGTSQDDDQDGRGDLRFPHADGPGLQRAAGSPSAFADVIREAVLGESTISGAGGRGATKSAHDRAGASGQEFVTTPEVPRRLDTATAGSPVAIALDRLLSKADRHENFGAALRAELSRAGWNPQHGNPAHSRIRRVWAGPRQERSAPRVEQTPWSLAALADLGLPAQVLEMVRGLNPVGDAAWLEAVAGAIAPLCRRLPAGDCVFAGPGVQDLLRGTAIPEVSVAGEFHPSGDIGIVVEDSDRGRNDLAWLRDGRWLHLVIGAGSWERLLLDEPLAVSYADTHHLPTAIRVAAECDLALGTAAVTQGGREGGDPVVIATALRSLLSTSTPEGGAADFPVIDRS